MNKDVQIKPTLADRVAAVDAVVSAEVVIAEPVVHDYAALRVTLLRPADYIAMAAPYVEADGSACQIAADLEAKGVLDWRGAERFVRQINGQRRRAARAK